MRSLEALIKPEPGRKASKDPAPGVFECLTPNVFGGQLGQ